MTGRLSKQASKISAKGAGGQGPIAGSEGVIRHFLFNHPLKQLEHLQFLGFILIERIPGIIEEFLQFIGRQLLGMIDHLVGGIIIPVVRKDPVSLLEIIIGLGVGKGGQYRKFSQIKLDLK